MRVAHAVGAGEWSRVRLIGMGGVGMALAVMSLFAAGFLLAGRLLTGWFVRDTATAALASQLLLVAGVFQIFDGTQVVAMSALRGLSDMRVPTVLAFVSYWLVALPAGYFIGIRGQYGPLGLWCGLALGLAVASTTLLIRFLVRTHPARMVAVPALGSVGKPTVGIH